MTREEQKKAIQNAEFTVFPMLEQRDLSVLLKLAELKKEKSRELLKRKPAHQSETEFLLSIAANYGSTQSALFRRSTGANDDAISKWLAITKNKSQTKAVQDNIQKFEPLKTADLREIAKLSEDVESIHLIQKILSEKYRIIFLIEPPLAGMKMDGCAYRLENGTPVIGLTLRHSRYDNFWFTLLHEISHVLLHYEQLETPIIDDLDAESGDEIEVEANRVAADALIPRQIWRQLWLHKDSLEHVERFSREAKVHPSIAAGMIRNKSKNFAMYSALVHSINVRKMLGNEDD